MHVKFKMKMGLSFAPKSIKAVGIYRVDGSHESIVFFFNYNKMIGKEQYFQIINKKSTNLSTICTCFTTINKGVYVSLRTTKFWQFYNLFVQAILTFFIKFLIPNYIYICFKFI